MKWLPRKFLQECVLVGNVARGKRRKVQTESAVLCYSRRLFFQCMRLGKYTVDDVRCGRIGYFALLAA